MGYRKLYKLSPSAFKYLWEDCKHCYYNKVVHNIALPSIGMPGIFNKMNSLAQDMAIGMRTTDFYKDLPPGKFEHKERFLRSTAIPNSEKAYIMGRFDLLTKFDDDTHGVIDLKITDPRSDNLYKFSKQLHAYKFALENPVDEAEKLVKKVSKMGLLVMSPENIKLKNGQIVFTANPAWHEIKENMPAFFSFIEEVVDLLENVQPEHSDNCAWCAYRQHPHFKKPASKQEDIPF